MREVGGGGEGVLGGISPRFIILKKRDLDTLLFIIIYLK